MTGYNVPIAMRGETNFPDLGTVAFEFEAGPATPKDDAEAAVLAALAVNGLVEIVTEKPAKGKAAKPETTSEDKEN